MFLNFSYSSTNLDFVHLCLPLFTFVYLCLPLFNWRIYAQILCLFLNNFILGPKKWIQFNYSCQALHKSWLWNMLCVVNPLLHEPPLGEERCLGRMWGRKRKPGPVTALHLNRHELWNNGQCLGIHSILVYYALQCNEGGESAPKRYL